MDTATIFNRFWKTCINQTPSAGKIHDLFTEYGKTVGHNQTALRTFNDPMVNIDVFAGIFTSNGLQETICL